MSRVALRPELLAQVERLYTLAKAARCHLPLRPQHPMGHRQAVFSG